MTTSWLPTPSAWMNGPSAWWQAGWTPGVRTGYRLGTTRTVQPLSRSDRRHSSPGVSSSWPGQNGQDGSVAAGSGAGREPAGIWCGRSPRSGATTTQPRVNGSRRSCGITPPCLSTLSLRDCSGGCRDPDVAAGEFGEDIEWTTAVLGRGGQVGTHRGEVLG